MFARSRDPRGFLTILGALVPFASWPLSGCGSSGSSPVTPGGEGGATYTTVVTTGGGVLPDATAIDPFESTSSSGSSSGAPSSGSSSGPGLDSGSSSGGSASSSSGGAQDASSSSSSSSGGSGSSCPGGMSDGGALSPVCGSQAGAVGCDLRQNTCCLTQTLVGSWLAGSSATCPSGQATIHCLQALDCPSGMSCCGVVEDIQGAVVSSCQNVPAGGNCPYANYTPFSLYQGVQLCKTNAECKNVTDAGAPEPCVHQTCFMGAMLSMCGVQSTAPLSCSASP